MPDLEFGCKFRKWGCRTVAPRGPLADHERGCTFEPMKCPLEEDDGDCGCNVTRVNFYQHFRDNHVGEEKR